MIITKDLASAAAFALLHENERHEDIAHDWHVDEGELEEVVSYLYDNTDMVEQFIADGIDGDEIQ